MTLEEELQLALEDAIMGQNLGPGLPGRVATAARAVLLRHGLGRSQVSARQVGAGVEVSILLPAPQARVRQIRLHLEAR
ncbi:MAG: hypothetical protein H6741_35295 [Alphaproteobacteria bacterium]|nr:hypothetical protein [Alphaproteobacteria bacterium]MCB9797976.1 hypothetical protein [Alphaproteobacteria bacterium]